MLQRKNERIRKLNERKIYLQLYEAMEALVHICRDGCRTIGPHDKDFREIKAPCPYSACRGLEMLVRHFASCKMRVSGGCSHCKRMWQLLELHSRLCADSNLCRVPLCRYTCPSISLILRTCPCEKKLKQCDFFFSRNFKVRIRKQNKKDEVKWRILVKKILRTKRIGSSPFFFI